MATAMVATSPAWAQQPVAAEDTTNADIVVTAQRRAERSLDVPITLTTVSSDQLQAAGANALSDVARIAPAVRFDNNAAFAQPSIRGIGTQTTNSGAGSNVGIYLDGFYSPNPLAADFQLLNIKSVQVLKGPQGTLFGRNTTGGAILVTTAEPSEEPHAEVKASYGSFNAKRVQGYGTIGLAQGIAFDLEGLWSKGDNYFTNIVDNDKKIGAYENWSVRAGLKMDVSDRLSILLRYTHSETDDPTSVSTNVFRGYVGGFPGSGDFTATPYPAGTYTTEPGRVATAPGEKPQFFSGTDIVQMTIKLDTDFADVTSYSQYRTEKSLVIENLDNTSLPNVFPLGAGGVMLDVGVKDKTYSQELLLTSKPGGRLQWSAGLFYFQSRDSWDIFQGDYRSPVQFGRSSTTTESFAAFADLTYQITPQLFITGGGRYSHDVVRDAYYTSGGYPALGFPPNLKGDKFTPRVILRYKPTDESSVYASFTKGYKAGTIDVGDASPTRAANQRNVRPEDINAYEVGFKYDDRKLAFDLAAYYYDYKNLQVSVFNGPALASVLNAATSRIWGLDGQVRYKLASHFDVNVGTAYTNGRYRQFTNAPVFQPAAPGSSALVPVSTNLTDVPMQRVPEFTGNIGARYSTDVAGGKFGLSGNLYYSSSFYYGPSGTQYKQNGYEVLALRAEWTDPSDTYTLAVFGDNLTNRRYRTQVIVNGFGGGAVWNAPATWGVQVGAKF